MTTATRAAATLAVGIALLCLPGCPGVDTDGIIDATTPAPCTVDADCGDTVACVFPNGDDQPGICDVDETQVSTRAPAPCSADEDCPEGISCVFAGTGDQDGFCDVEETLAP